MLAEVTSFAVYVHPHPGWDAPGPGGPGWWLLAPGLFWLLVLAALGYLIYRRSPARSARAAAERTLVERYARGDIDEEELKRRRAVLRGRS